MQLTKKYSHLFQANLPESKITVTPTTTTPTPTPTPTPPPSTPLTTPTPPATPKSFSDLDNNKPENETTVPVKSSAIPKIVIIGLIIFIAFLIYRLVPKNYNDCTNLPGSQVTNGTCTTFWRHSFKLTTDAGTITPTPSTTPTTVNPYLPRVTVTPASTSATTYLPTTKGGLPLITPIPTHKTVVTNTNPVPTSAPTSDTSVPSDWVKHRYPEQHISLWLPAGWNGSDAVHNRNTNLTTFYLGGPNSIIVVVKSNTINPSGNYQVNGTISATKTVNPTTTLVEFSRGGLTYQVTCQNSLWGTCNTMLQNLEFN